LVILSVAPARDPNWCRIRTTFPPKTRIERRKADEARARIASCPCNHWPTVVPPSLGKTKSQNYFWLRGPIDATIREVPGFIGLLELSQDPKTAR
jgi:hypothetical protein